MSEAREDTPTLSSLLSMDGIVQCLMSISDASALTKLASCSSATASAFVEPQLWRNLLTQHFGMKHAEVDFLVQPRRLYAQRFICQCWGIELPHALAECRCDPAGLKTPKPLSSKASNLLSPETLLAKVNKPPRSGLKLREPSCGLSGELACTETRTRTTRIC